MSFLKNLLLIFLLLLVQLGAAQENSISLGECYILAEKNYPLAQQRGLIEKSEEYSLSNAAKGYYPQANIYGRATYQSDVTQIPIVLPGMEIPTLDKDQYKVYGEVSLNLYDGGIIKREREMIRAKAETERQKLQVQLYTLKKRVNQLFFGVLLLKAQLRQNELYQKDIQLGIDNIQSAIKNGTALKSEGERLQAELLRAEQKAIGLRAAQRSYLEMLGLFIGREITSETLFIKPEPVIATQEIMRPKLDFFQSQIKQIEQDNAMLSAKNRPKLDFFVQGGYGRPALNMLSNDFEAYYLGGIRLNIPLSGFYTLKKERALLGLKKMEVKLQKQTFLLNTRMEIEGQKSEIDKFNSLLATDNRIISLRQSVKKTMAAQLEYGLVGTNDYLREANAENQARQNKDLHEIQLLMAQYELQWTKGQK